MIPNEPFVMAVKEIQETKGLTQAEFARDIGVSQGALSKFYSRGIRDGVVIKILAKYPKLAYFFALKDSSNN